MGNKYGEQKIPFGGVFNYPTVRLSSGARTVVNQAMNQDFSGNDIVLDNGFTAGFNRVIAGVESFIVPIASKAPINDFRVNGKRALPDNLEIPGITDPSVTKKDIGGDYSHGGIFKEMLQDAMGATFEHVDAYSKRQEAFSSYAREQGWGIERDREGRISIHGYQPWQIAQFRLWDDKNNDGSIYQGIRHEVENRAQSDNKDAELQVELYKLIDDRDDDLRDISRRLGLPPEHDDYLGPASARTWMSGVERDYYDDRSGINRKRGLDPHEEPEDPDSDEHLLWEYYSLFNMATVSKKAGMSVEEILENKDDPNRYSDIEFDVELFSSLFEELKQTLDPDEIEYINKNRNLAELEYPEELQQIKQDMRAISDRKWKFDITDQGSYLSSILGKSIFELSWWELMDEGFTRPLMFHELTNPSYGSLRHVDMSNPANVQKIEDALDRFFHIPDEVSIKYHRSDFETMDSEWVGRRTLNAYISDAYGDIISKDGTVYRVREAFIADNEDIKKLLFDYGFEFPGRSEMKEDVQTGKAQLVGP